LTNFEKLQTNYVAIKDQEAKRADLDKEIEGYLKELGLLE
jgi:type I restriction enzyme M protein